MSILQNVMLFNMKIINSLMGISMDFSTPFVNYCIPPEYQMARLALTLFIWNIFFVSVILLTAFFCSASLGIIVYYVKGLLN